MNKQYKFGVTNSSNWDEAIASMKEAIDTAEGRSRRRCLQRGPEELMWHAAYYQGKTGGEVPFQYVATCPRYKGGGYNGSLNSTIVEFNKLTPEQQSRHEYALHGSVLRGEYVSAFVWRIPREFNKNLTPEHIETLKDMKFSNRGGVWGRDEL